MFLFLHLFLLQLVLDILSILEVINKGLGLSFSFTLICFDLHVISGSCMTPRHSLFRIFNHTATNWSSGKCGKCPSSPSRPSALSKMLEWLWATQARRWTSTARVWDAELSATDHVVTLRALCHALQIHEACGGDRDCITFILLYTLYLLMKASFAYWLIHYSLNSHFRTTIQRGSHSKSKEINSKQATATWNWLKNRAEKR